MGPAIEKTEYKVKQEQMDLTCQGESEQMDPTEHKVNSEQMDLTISAGTNGSDAEHKVQQLYGAKWI
jgi:hypothetical protein